MSGRFASIIHGTETKTASDSGNKDIRSLSRKFESRRRELVMDDKIEPDIKFYVGTDPETGESRCEVCHGDWHDEDQIDPAMTLAHEFFDKVTAVSEGGRPKWAVSALSGSDFEGSGLREEVGTKDASDDHPYGVLCAVCEGRVVNRNRGNPPNYRCENDHLCDDAKDLETKDVIRYTGNMRIGGKDPISMEEAMESAGKTKEASDESIPDRIKLLRAGSCCGNDCADCPYSPRHEKGNTKRDGGWVGFDLDGTLAEEFEGEFHPENIGDPNPEILRVLKLHLDEGDEVRIFTARASDKENHAPIRAWLKEHGLPELEITNTKDPACRLIYDNIAVSVNAETGDTKRASDGNAAISILRRAKAKSDAGDYDSKHALLVPLMSSSPGDFVIDSEGHGHPGITHLPTGFRFHVPYDKIPMGVAKAVKASANRPVSNINSIPDMRSLGQKTFREFMDMARRESSENGSKVAIVEPDEPTGKWILWSKDRSKKLGTHDTARQAYAQEHAIKKSQEAKRGNNPAKTGFYTEDGSFTHDGSTYSLSDAFASAGDPEEMSVKDLEWVLQYDTPDPERLARADVSAPLLVTYSRNGKPTVIDGLHRLAKAKSMGMDKIKIRWVQMDKVSDMNPEKSVRIPLATGKKEDKNMDKTAADLDGDGVPDPVADATMAIWGAVRAAVGTGDPIHPATREKNVKGIMAQLTGAGNGPKTGFVQSKVLGHPVNTVGRGVVIPDSRLDMDQVGVPVKMAWTLYKDHAIGTMVKQGLDPADALEHFESRSNIAKKALVDTIRNRPVMLSRDPALHRHNIMGQEVVLVPGNSIRVSPLIIKGFNMDFDGDQGQIHVPLTDRAIKDIREKMMPSQNLFGTAKWKPMYEPSQEFILGIYNSTSVNGDPEMEFDSEDDMMKAYEENRIGLDTKVKIRDSKPTSNPASMLSAPPSIKP